ncbi:MAG: transporter [Gammaproteobacteria bacterium]|nr:transporter [Gammaproteobacteria bacterium]
MQFPSAMMLAAALLPLPLFAAHPLITEDTGTQGQGNFQLELTSEHAYEEEEGARETTVRTNAVLSYGLRDNADAILTLPHRRISSEAADGNRTVNQGTADIGLDLKWRFYEQGNLSFALKPGLTMPTGDETRNLGTGRSTRSLYLVISYDAAPWEYHLHFGYIHNRNILGQHESLRHISAAVGRKVGDNLRLVADYGADTPASRASSLNTEFFILGAIYSVRKGLDLDFGAKWGLTPPEADFTWLAGVTFRF